jgi:hypothetical protein
MVLQIVRLPSIHPSINHIYLLIILKLFFQSVVLTSDVTDSKKQPTLTASICKFLVPSNTITFLTAIHVVTLRIRNDVTDSKKQPTLTASISGAQAVLRLVDVIWLKLLIVIM